MQGLNTEYERLRKESEGKGAVEGPGTATSEGPSSVQGLRKEVQSLQVPFWATLWPSCTITCRVDFRRSRSASALLEAAVSY